VLDKPAGAVDEFPHHGLDAPPPGLVSHWRVRPVQNGLAHQAQDSHGQRSEFAHEVVGVELARGQPLEAHVGLELRVELLEPAVVGVQRDERLGREVFVHQARRPALEGELRLDQMLAPRVDGALHEPQHAAHRPLDAFDVHGLLAHGHALARQPAVVVRVQRTRQPGRIEARVQPRQDRRPGSCRTRALRHRQHAVDVGQPRRELLQVVAHQGQDGHRGEVVIELLDDERAHAANSLPPRVRTPSAFTRRVRLYPREVTESGTGVQSDFRYCARSAIWPGLRPSDILSL
jgi:hypothetical protein